MQGSISHSRNIIRRTLYQLKYRYGYPVSFYKVIKGNFNPVTGVTPFTTNNCIVNRAIIMPSAVQRNFFFSISVIQANSKFITGGDIQLQDRQIIIDGRDLPIGWIINIDDYFIWQHQRYDIKTAEALEYGTGWVINGRKIQGADNNETHSYMLSDYILPFDSYGAMTNGSI